jgi:hypothetical protein
VRSLKAKAGSSQEAFAIMSVGLNAVGVSGKVVVKASSALLA